MRIAFNSLLVICMLNFFIPKGEELAIEQLLEFAHDNHYEIESGELTVKESFALSQVDRLEEQIIQNGFTNENSSINVYTRELSADLQEEVMFIDTNDERGVMVNYQLSGDIRSAFEQENYNTKIKSFIQMIYTNYKREYACIRLIDRGKIELDVFLKRVIDNLELIEIDRIEENNFVVISGHSAQFNREIPTVDGQMNTQISARKGTDEIITYHIGTPILVGEY